MVVRGCVAMLQPRANEDGVRIDNRVSGMRIALRGDARALKQIVLNLLSNAVKFTPSGGMVSLRIEKGGRGNGSGHGASALQPFQQADSSIGRRFGGSGLGLAISRKQLALHGGVFTIDSTPGHGTTVRASIPLNGLSKPRQWKERLHQCPRYLPDALDQRTSRRRRIDRQREQHRQLPRLRGE